MSESNAEQCRGQDAFCVLIPLMLIASHETSLWLCDGLCFTGKLRLRGHGTCKSRTGHRRQSWDLNPGFQGPFKISWLGEWDSRIPSPHGRRHPSSLVGSDGQVSGLHLSAALALRLLTATPSFGSCPSPAPQAVRWCQSQDAAPLLPREDTCPGPDQSESFPETL